MKSILEKVLIDNYFCISIGETIFTKHNNKDFYINVVETRLASTTCIVNADYE